MEMELEGFGVAESAAEYVKAIVIEVCQSIVGEDLQQASVTINVAHCLGKPNPSNTAPRVIIIRFSQRSNRDDVWKAAKTCSFLRE